MVCYANEYKKKASMFDKEIVLYSLQQIKAAIETLLERAAVVKDPNDFLCSPGGIDVACH